MGGYGVAVFAHRVFGGSRFLRYTFVMRCRRMRFRRRLDDTGRRLPARLAFVGRALHLPNEGLRCVLHFADHLPGAASHLRQLVRPEDDQRRRSDDEHISR